MCIETSQSFLILKKNNGVPKSGRMKFQKQKSVFEILVRHFSRSPSGKLKIENDLRLAIHVHVVFIP